MEKKDDRRFEKEMRRAEIDEKDLESVVGGAEGRKDELTESEMKKASGG